MQAIDHGKEALDQWRPGVMTRMRISAQNGAAQLCVFEQFVEPGKGAPTHYHTVEEVLTVLTGTADIWIGDEHAIFTAGQSAIIPPGLRHGFENVGETTLHVQAILAAPIFEAAFDDQTETRRRWEAA